MAKTEIPVSLGKLLKSKEDFWFGILPNSTSSQNRNFLLDAKQGTGKTNMTELFVYELYRLYMETDGEYGALPIVFSPLFEYSNIRYESSDQNLGPERDPEGLESLQYCFEMSNPPPDDKTLTVIYVDFNDLTIEDLVSFAGLNENTQVLGHLQKLFEDLRKTKPDYDIDDFIESMRESKPLYDALYYIFTKLKKRGFFNNKYHKFNWLEALKHRKPIVFNFGDINTRDIYNTLTGYFLRKLFELSTVYYNAYTKKDRIEKSTLKGETTSEKITEDEQWLVDNFYIALLLEESHQILYALSGNPNLENYPAHYTYKQISDLLGRKKGFKYNFLVTQRIMELYKYFRNQQNFLLLGSEIYAEDVDFMIKEMKFPKNSIGHLIDLPKYAFSIIDVHALRARKKESAVKFFSWRAPCGQFKVEG